MMDHDKVDVMAGFLENEMVEKSVFLMVEPMVFSMEISRLKGWDSRR